MGNSAKYDKYFYFRSVIDEDDDDTAVDSVMVPVKNITGMEPYNAITNVRVWFDNTTDPTLAGGSFDKTANQQSYADLTVTRGKLKEVMATIAAATNAGPHSDGVTVIADDTTTDFDGSTRLGKYIHNDITACEDIVLV